MKNVSPNVPIGLFFVRGPLICQVCTARTRSPTFLPTAASSAPSFHFVHACRPFLFCLSTETFELGDLRGSRQNNRKSAAAARTGQRVQQQHELFYLHAEAALEG